MRSKIPYFLLLLLIPFIIAGQSKKVLKAGAATSNITPPLGLPIVGNFGEPMATNIHDELHARSLILDDGETRLVFVLIDNVGVNQAMLDSARNRVSHKTGIPQSHILMASVHDHSAVSAGGLGSKRKGWPYGKPLDEYQKFLLSRLSDVVEIAIHRLRPAKIAWGNVDIPEHLFNRRYFMKERERNPLGGWDTVRMNPGVGNPNVIRPAGETDPEVSFISLKSLDDEPIALLANYSLHYVGGVPRGDISGDYFAVFANRIEELLKTQHQEPPFVGIMSNGTSGDVNNVDVMGNTSKIKRKPYEKMQMVANDIAEKVFHENQNLSFKDWVKLDAIQTRIPLKIRRASPQTMVNIAKVLGRSENEKPLFHSLEKAYAKRILQMELEWPDTLKVPLQTFKIGDLGVASIPFEVFTETGLNIKRRSPFSSTFTIEIANGYNGYLPTPEQHQWGGYETWLSTNKVEEEASVKIEDEIIRLFGRLK